MTGIIITGHGHFPTGLLSAVSLVAGKPEKVEAVDFTEGMSSEELKGGSRPSGGTGDSDFSRSYRRNAFQYGSRC